MSTELFVSTEAMQSESWLFCVRGAEKHTDSLREHRAGRTGKGGKHLHPHMVLFCKLHRTRMQHLCAGLRHSKHFVIAYAVKLRCG